MENHTGLPHTLQRRTILALNELGQTVTASLRLEEVFARVLGEVTALLKADGAAILLPEDERLVFAAVGGRGAMQLKGAGMPRNTGAVSYTHLKVRKA